MSEGENERVYPTYSLLERTSPDEWLALSADNKAIFQLIISAGTVAISSTSNVRSILLGLFPPNTITGAKFALL